MKDIAIYGAGGFGREVACLIISINKVHPKWNLIGFFDDNLKKGFSNEYGNVLGSISELNLWNDELAIAIAIGNPVLINNIVDNIYNPLIIFPNLLAPDLTCLDDSTLKLGKGNIICSQSIISCHVEIGDFNILNLLVTIGHDSKIGSFNVFMPAVNISGAVSIGNKNFMGVSSAILQQIKIGNGVRIGAGSIVIRKTEDDFLYIGNPAVKVRF